jgi:hypothetical protein
LITKAEVIELYLSSKVESEKLLQLMQDVDTDDLKFQENLLLLQNHLALIDIFFQRMHQNEPTQEELKHHFNMALSWGIDSN